MEKHLNNSAKKKKIAIYGGSFDPPTIAHIQVAAEVYNRCEDIDEVWFTPCGDNRDDKKLRTSGEHRAKMLSLILKDTIEECVPIKICHYELIKEKYYPTYFLLKELEEVYPTYEFLFCVGSDVVKTLKKWQNGEELFNQQKFIIIDRPLYHIEQQDLPVKSRKLSAYFDGSSTNIRNRICDFIEKKNKLNLGINGLTTTSVIKYIKEHGLYLDYCSVKNLPCINKDS